MYTIDLNSMSISAEKKTSRFFSHLKSLKIISLIIKLNAFFQFGI